MAETNSTRGVYRFAIYEVDSERRELRKQGVRLRIQDQPFLILLTLLERAGEVVTREELTSLLWPDGTFVDFERGLNAAVARLRRCCTIRRRRRAISRR